MVQIPEGTFCPLIRDDCIQFKCKFWTHLRGSNPQTGDALDEYDCAVKWLPMLLIEGANETRKTAASVQSFRNEMVKINTLSSLKEIAQ